MTFSRVQALDPLGFGLRGAVIVYAAVTAILFRELLPNVATHLYSDLGDPLLNASILAWNAMHPPLARAWWDFPSFAPLSGVTALTEHLLLTYPVASPVIWLTGNPVLAYNILFLIAVPLNGVAAWALARELTGSSAAALIAGLAYAFAPYQAVHLSHLQQMTSFGMPFALLWLHRYLRTGHRRALVWFGLGWLVTALANSALLVFFPILVLLWSVWFVRPREWRRLLGPAVAATIATLPLVPLLYGYHVRQAAHGFFREYSEIRSFSADIVGLLGMYYRAVPWRGVLPRGVDEGVLFPGFTTVALGVVAVLAMTKGAGVGLWPRRLMRAFVLLTLIVLARVWAGPFGWHIGPLPLPAFSPYRLFTFAALMLIAGVLLTKAFRRAWGQRDVVMFYAVAASILWLITLGPEPEWSTPWRALTHGPYALLVRLPGMQSIRVPARAWFPGILCLAVLAAFGTAVLLQRYARHARTVLVAIAVAVVAEGWFSDQIVEAPQLMRRGVIPKGAVVLDLPAEEAFRNAVPQYRAVMGGYRTINGYSGYLPPHFTPLRRAIADIVPGALDPYRHHGALYVIIRPGLSTVIARWIASHPGAEHLFDVNDARVYRLPQVP
ncbi:MAG: hypothetical protein ACRD3C_06350 [Vicinamibacterales bacterium]